MKRKLMVLALVAMFLVSITGTAFAATAVVQSPFTDIADNDPLVKDYAILNALGIFEGYPDGSMRPTGTLTRAEFTKVVITMLGKQNVATALQTMTPAFTDAANIDVWARGFINAAHTLGIVQGRTDGRFDPNAIVEHREVVTMLVRALGYEVSIPAGAVWPTGHVAKAAEIGLLVGVDFIPAFMYPTTREDMVIMTVNAVKAPPSVPLTGAMGDPDKSILKLAWITGNVSAVTDSSITLVGKGTHTLAPRVALFGANSLAALVGSDVNVLKRGNQVLYIETTKPANQVTGKWTAYLSVSNRITVGGNLYNVDKDATVMVNGLAILGTHDGLDNYGDTFSFLLKDKEVTITLTAGVVTKITATLNTYEDKFLQKVTVVTNETDFGRIEVDGDVVEVDSGTQIWLNGEAVTLKGLADAAKDFRDDWTSTENAFAMPVVTVQNFGNNPHGDLEDNEAVAQKIWAWTDNTVTGKITAIGSGFVRVDGVRFNTKLSLTTGQTATFLLNSKDAIVDVIDTAIVTDVFFAKFMEFGPKNTEGFYTAVVELANGDEVTLTSVDDSFAMMTRSDMLGKVIVVTIDLNMTYDGTFLHEVHFATDAGVVEPVYGVVDTKTSTWLRLVGEAGVFPLDTDVFVFRADITTPAFGNMTHVTVGKDVMLGLIDGVVGFIVVGHPDPAA